MLHIEVPTPKSFRLPKSTDWSIFKSQLARCVENIDSDTVRLSLEEIEQWADSLQSAICSSYEAASPLRVSRNKKNSLWWNNALTKLRKKLRKLFNKAQKTKSLTDWDYYAAVRAAYKEEIRKAKRESWEKFCENVETIHESARMQKILSRNPNMKLGSMQIETGVYTDSMKESTMHLFEVHFPGCCLINELNCDSAPVNLQDEPADSDWIFASNLAHEKRIFWALSSFTPFKSPGADGIFPALLQHGFPIFKNILCTIFRSCIAFGYIPKAWRISRVVFIPKPGRGSYDNAKSYRPICLSSFFLKTLERLIDWHIREKCLISYPLHVNQHAYQRGKSVETALHKIVTEIEKALDQKVYALGTFLDIEGAFDKTTVMSINLSLIDHGVPDTLIKLITFVLRNRLIIADYGLGSIIASVKRGCPQGGVLSPLLWCLVLDSLIRELNTKMLFTTAYADDLAILISGKFCDVISERTQLAANIVAKWCSAADLTVNPAKSECVLFTNKRTSAGLRNIRIFGKEIRMAESVKYLGVILDKKLSWKEHFRTKAKKAIAIFWQCRGAIGRSWGLSPRSVLWIYTAVVRPMLMHASIVWWHRAEISCVQSQFSHIQRIACMGILGPFKTTPTAALETITSLPPLHLFAEMVARKTVVRLVVANQWIKTGKTNVGHRKIWGKLAHESSMATMHRDCMVPIISTTINFNYKIDSREEWSLGHLIPTEGVICFTDGSLMNNSAGAGVFCNRPNIEISFPLGALTSVFQSEVFAILLCSGHESITNLVGSNIYICSDSQAAIRALCSPIIQTPLVKQCRESLCCLSYHNSVTLLWVPGHSGVEGNEKADNLARAASCMSFYGPEPSLGVSLNTIKRDINEWCSLSHRKHWLNRLDCRQSKQTLDAPDKNTSKLLLNIPRRVLRHVVAVLTGHGQFNYHLFSMSLVSSSSCGFCNEGTDDTAVHFMCECPAFAALRARFYGSHYVAPHELKLNIAALTGYIKKSGRFAYN